ncbi:MAG: MFS transporter [Myxococcales bacterium]|nr:MFS transporter [Myxococcales bacterium]
MPPNSSASATRIRSIVGGSLGNLVEWYDWFSYAAFALYFAKSFFPEGDATAQLLKTSIIFAIGFLMRPVGAWLLGIIADRHGRKTALVASVTLMCVGSGIIAITPGYHSIGVAAPIILGLARMLQGLSVGGEFGASATYLAEIAEPERRGYWGSYQYVTMMLGQLLAFGVLLLLQYVVLDETRLEAWGWRIPFLIGALLAVVVYYVRRSITETPDFLNATRKRGVGLADMLQHRRAVLLVFGMAIGSNVAFYAFTSYMQKYLAASAGFSRGQASLICTLATVVFVIAQPLAGALSDRIGRKPLLLWFGILGAGATVPLMTAIGATRDPYVAFALVLATLLILCGTTSVSATAKAEMFPPEVRALGVGFPYAISTSIFAGTAELIALQFKTSGHESGFFWYVSACVAVSLVAILFVPETRWSSKMASTSAP